MFGAVFAAKGLHDTIACQLCALNDVLYLTVPGMEEKPDRMADRCNFESASQPKARTNTCLGLVPL